MKSYGRRAISTLVVSATTSILTQWASPVAAAEQGLEEVEEIVVTAQRREQRLSDIGMAVSAVSGDDLSKRLLTSLQDMNAAVPSLAVSDYGGYNMIAIRGVGLPLLNLGVDSGTAVHMNGVYVSRVYDGRVGFMDLERVEVLRGPQGTLYGRNATSGSVNLVSRMPTHELDGYARLTYGNYENVVAEGAIGGPISDRWLGRLAVRKVNRNGYWKNLFDGKHYGDADTSSARGTLRFEATDSLTFTAIFDYHKESDGNYPTHFFGQGVPGQQITGILIGGPEVAVPLDANGQSIDPRLLNVDSIPTNKRKLWGGSLEIEWKLSDAVKAKSLTAYRSGDYFWGTDFDGSSWSFPSNTPGFSYLQDEGFDQFSQELQLIGAGDRFKWVAGLYYLRDKMDPISYDFGFAPAPFVFGLRAEGKGITDAYAAYGQVEYSVNDRLSLTAGLRYTYEDRSTEAKWTTAGFPLSGFPPCLDLADAPLCQQKAAESFDDVTPSLAINYRLTSGLMAYALVSKGFKSGGFSSLDLKPAYQPEKAWAYEGGLKFRSPVWNLSLDSAVFYYNYSDQQIGQVIDGFVSTINAAKSEIYGAELEARIEPVRGLTFSAALSYLHAEYTSFLISDPAHPELGIQDLSGNRLPMASKFSSNVNVSYLVPLGSAVEMNLMFNWNRRSHVYFTEFNLPNAERPSVSTYDAALRFSVTTGARWYLELWGKNLSDETIISQSFVSSGTYGRPRNGQLEPPRTYGATLGIEF